MEKRTTLMRISQLQAMLQNPVQEPIATRRSSLRPPSWCRHWRGHPCLSGLISSWKPSATFARYNTAYSPAPATAFLLSNRNRAATPTSSPCRARTAATGHVSPRTGPFCSTLPCRRSTSSECSKTYSSSPHRLRTPSIRQAWGYPG